MNSRNAGRVLIVDDDVSTIEVVNEALIGTCEVLFATRGGQAMEIARIAKPDVILLDVMMPEMDGYELCTRLHADSATAATPVIFITGLGDLSAEIRALELGAVDFVTKPINPTVVRLRVRNQIDLRRAREQAERLSDTDGLTGLANRRHFDRSLDVEFRRLHRSGAPLSLILLDIDHFKPYNDHYGHVAGDVCLRQVAELIRGSVTRAADVAARYGGEEFAVILPEAAHSGAVIVAERIRNAIEEAGIVHQFSPVAEHITASLGVVSVTCSTLDSLGDVVKLADQELYKAKAAGRNRISALDRTKRPRALVTSGRDG